MKIKEIMRRVRTISPDSTIKEAACLMNQNKIGCLVVSDKNNDLKGIITERDILQKVTAIDKLPSKMAVKQIMSKEIITIESGALLDDAVYLMMKNKIKKLPVIENDELVGIITATDIVAHSTEVGEFYLFD